MPLFRFLLIFLLIYLGIRFISRLLFPAPNSGNNTSNTKRKEGEVIIEDTPQSKTKNISKDEGDYVDYEEVG
jgi:Domain of unknown function (DUF4834)